MPLYEGDAPFIFISYAHKDRELVLPYIRRLEELHYRVWYDKDIRTGTPQWAPVIQQHLKRCKVVVVFLTNGYLASENCGNELEYARNHIGSGYIHLLRMQELDEALLDATGFSLNFARAHILPADRMSQAEVISEISRGFGMAECREKPEENPFEFFNEPKPYQPRYARTAEPESVVQAGFTAAMPRTVPAPVTTEAPAPVTTEKTDEPEVMAIGDFLAATKNNQKPPVIATKVFCEFLVFGLLVILLTYAARSEWLEVHPLLRLFAICGDVGAGLCGMVLPLAHCDDVEKWYRETYGIEKPMEHPLEWKFIMLATVIPGCMMLWAKVVLQPQSVIINILWWAGAVLLGVLFMLGMAGHSEAKSSWEKPGAKK